MTTTPDQIRSDIERTRAGLSDDVNQLADSVDPRQIAHRQTEKVKDAVVGVKDKVMGSDTTDAARTAARSPQRAAGWARDQTTSNPWAAGVIALGVGWMIGSVLPATDPERAVVGEARSGLSDQVGAVVGEMKEHLGEPVAEAVETVKGSAQQAADTVKDSASPSSGQPSTPSAS